MEVSKINRRIAGLETEFRKLHGRVRELEGSGGTPIFVNLSGASKLFGMSAARLRYHCQSGKLEGIAFKVPSGRKDPRGNATGNWLLHVRKLEAWIVHDE